MHPVLARDAIDGPAEAFLRASGTVFATFDRRTQDSGNASFGVRIGSEPYFIKTAGSPLGTGGALPHPARVALLENAVVLARRVRHPALPELLHVIASPEGPCLVYEWVDGELLGAPSAQRRDPASAFQRFRRLPAAPRLGRVVSPGFGLGGVKWSVPCAAQDTLRGCWYRYSGRWRRRSPGPSPRGGQLREAVQGWLNRAGTADRSQEGPPVMTADDAGRDAPGLLGRARDMAPAAAEGLAASFTTSRTAMAGPWLVALLGAHVACEPGPTAALAVSGANESNLPRQAEMIHELRDRLDDLDKPL